MLRKKPGPLLSGELIGEEANRGNAVANLINIMNPQKIIIGGTLGDTGPLLTRLIFRAAALGAACLPLRYKLELLQQK
jgi:predicted NBD/HSP70 family sugar kinase